MIGVPTIQRLISLPPGMSPGFEELTGRRFPAWFAASDPEGGVGSGGGTAWILAQAWRRENSGQTFEEWINGGRRLIIHSGGKSRRLPEFAPQGKVFMPVPTEHARGQQALRWLLDDLVETGDDVFDAAPTLTKVVILAGDVRFRVGQIVLPEADLAVAGMASHPEEASHHGVFVTDRTGRISRMLQKPRPEELPSEWLLDIGIWGLSTRAVLDLMAQCGWTGTAFAGKMPKTCDLYSEFGPSASSRGLTTAACEVQGDFIHLGTTEQFCDHWRKSGGESQRPSLDNLPTEDHAEFFASQRRQAAEWAGQLPTSIASLLDLRQAKALGASLTVEPKYAHLMMQGEKEAAFSSLSQEILDEERICATSPRPGAGTVSAGAPLRLDLAGGWTDTPPYCLQNAASVVNLSVKWGSTLPSQVSISPIDGPDIEIVSTDRNQAFTLRSTDELPPLLRRADLPAIGLAALHLCGIGPQSFDGGFRLTITSLAPEGSGLGASSILAATVLGALNAYFQLEWTHSEIVQRTLWLEQLIGSHGGWQDQAGGIYPGLKLLSSGTDQLVDVRHLPDGLVRSNPCVLLYNTGIQRRAFKVLGEIVEGMFLNDHDRLRTLAKIRHNAVDLVDVLERGTYEQFGRALRRSWELNQELDSGTNTPAIQALLDPVDDLMYGGKLLGAGGGGFFFLAAKDEDAAASIRRVWQEINPAGEFMDWQIADQGLAVDSFK